MASGSFLARVLGRGVPIFLALSVIVFLVLPSRALACGASASSGGVSVCSLRELREKERPKWHAAGSYAWTETKLRFSGDELEGRTTYAQTRHAAFASLSWRFHPAWSVRVGVGALLGGSLRFEEGRTVLDRSDQGLRPGPAVVVGGSFVASRGKGAIPFVLLDGQIAALFSGTDSGSSYSAADLRLGASVGWRVADVFLPYALLRGFGGPVFWKLDGNSVRGTDAYHYQVGLGASVVIARKVDLFVEGVPLGERGVSAGVGVAF